MSLHEPRRRWRRRWDNPTQQWTDTCLSLSIHTNSNPLSVLLSEGLKALLHGIILAYGFWQKAWTSSRKVNQSFMWLTTVLAVTLFRESVFGRKHASLTMIGLFFPLTASQFYNLCKTFTHTQTRKFTHIYLSNPENS